MSANPRRQKAQVSGSANVTSASSIVLPRNTNMIERTIVNTGATDVSLQLETSLGVNPTAVAGQGVFLKANGGSWSTNVFSGAIAAIVASGTGTLAITEV